MLAVTKGVALFDVVAHLTTPVAHLAVVLAPGVHGTVTNSYLGPSSSFTLEVGGLVHVAINATAYSGNGIGSSELFRTLVHRKSFSL